MANQLERKMETGTVPTMLWVKGENRMHNLMNNYMDTGTMWWYIPTALWVKVENELKKRVDKKIGTGIM